MSFKRESDKLTKALIVSRIQNKEDLDLLESGRKKDRFNTGPITSTEVKTAHLKHELERSLGRVEVKGEMTQQRIRINNTAQGDILGRKGAL